jgi:hypothetical protein
MIDLVQLYEVVASSIVLWRFALNKLLLKGIS